jgi:S-adenosylmethionine:tRNA ribosyltransferase-isomerase
VPGHRTSDYDFALPSDRIAQTPTEPRDSSRLLILDRASGTITHGRFADLVTLIPPGDVLVLNTTRVFRARLLGTRDSGAPAEILLLRDLGEGMFEAMVSPGGKLRPGRTVRFAPGFAARIVSVSAAGTRVVHLSADTPIDDAIDRYGHVPLPPYIARADVPADAERYQTVYARERGSVAAPTAGLHFTAEMLAALAARGVRRADVLLHVGAGTFKPVEVDDPAHHAMHEEWFQVSTRAAGAVNDAHARGAGAWAVGTTAARAIESAAAEDGTVGAGASTTRIFIRPPYAFRAVDHLVTNFHLPRSTLIMLVAALAGFELTMRAYHEAIAAGYRFYSYGDAMVII